VRLVILDRDGVINKDSPDYIKSVAEWIPLPGSLDAIGRLNQAGFHTVVATNQSGVARGLLDIEMLARIHEHMHQALAAHGATVDAVFFCPCGPDDECDCRKPKPGLLHQIAERTHTNLATVACIGDSRRDIEAARAAGAKPILVRTGNGVATEPELPSEWKVPVYDDLAAAAEALITAHNDRTQ
jgi:D-glycero-D-manno-heptose 1,7-bisphosphate phosphatase